MLQFGNPNFCKTSVSIALYLFSASAFLRLFTTTKIIMIATINQNMIFLPLLCVAIIQKSKERIYLWFIRQYYK